MFWKRKQKVNLIFQWTSPRQPSKNFWVELGKLDARVLRIPSVGLAMGLAAYSVVQFILPNIQIRWLENIGISLAVITPLALLFFIAYLYVDAEKSYAMTDVFVNLIVKDKTKFVECFAFAIAPTRTHFELVSRTGKILYLELPQDETLKEQILEYVQTRVKPWKYADLPSQIMRRAGVLEGAPLLAYWVVSLFLAFVAPFLVSSLLVSMPLLSEAASVALVFTLTMIGSGLIWAWSEWFKLRVFPIAIRFRMAVSMSFFANGLWFHIFFLLLRALSIQRITP